MLDIAADGRWLGTNGCTTTSGRWIAGPDGLVMATSGIPTGMDCPDDDVPVGLYRARRAGFDGQLLVLFDADGTQLVRLKPTPRSFDS